MPNRLIANRFNKITENTALPYRDMIIKFSNIQNKFIYKKIRNWISGKNVLDIGTGIGGFAYFLQDKGYNVKSIDVDNSSLFAKFPTKIYDGYTIPYDAGEFDTSLLVHVLHHCTNRMRVLREALRVSKRVILVEDTYRNKLEWLVGSINDAIGNGEYYFHKYSTPSEWRKILERENCNILYEESYSRFTYHFLYGRYVIFVVEKNQ